MVPQTTGTRLITGSRHPGFSASRHPPPEPFSSSVVAWAMFDLSGPYLDLLCGVSCVSSVSGRCWVNAADQHETVHLESGMRYHFRHSGPI